MINSIIEAISVSLNSEFGDGYKIYMEEIEQGLEEPCFFIFCLKPSNDLFLGKRYFRTNPFCIQYFPESREKQRECNGVAEQMYDCLEYITMDSDTNPIHGTKMKHEVVDGVLSFFVNYDCFVYKIAEQQDSMYGIKASVNIKEEGG